MNTGSRVHFPLERSPERTGSPNQLDSGVGLLISDAFDPWFSDSRRQPNFDDNGNLFSDVNRHPNFEETGVRSSESNRQPNLLDNGVGSFESDAFDP